MAKPVIPEPSPRFFGWSLAVGVVIVAVVAVFRCFRDRVSKMISKTITPDRSKIIIEHKDHVKYWTRHFGVTKDELTRAVEKVGNSAAAVRKQLGRAEAVA